MNANQNRNWPVSPLYQQPVQQARPQAHAVAQARSLTQSAMVAQQARPQAHAATVAQQARPQAHAATVAPTDQASEIWHVQVAAGDVRVVDLDKLDDLFRFEVIDEDAFVWQTGMQKWARLGDLLGPADEETEEPFHVLLGPGNVRVLTLDELNDFYRYEVIDESTLIWQKGMAEWQTLGRVAGIDEAVLPLPAAAPSAAPQNQNRAAASTPPSARNGSVAIASAHSTLPMPAVSPLPNAAGLATLPTHGITRPAPLVQVVASAPFSTRPVSLSIEPYANTTPPRAGRWLLRFAVAAGVILAMLRNDVVYAALGKSPMLAQYEQAERSVLGGPAFGTTRSVEQLVASCGGHLDAVHLPIAVTQFSDAHKSGAVLDAKRSEAEVSSPKDVAASQATPTGTTSVTKSIASAAQAQTSTPSASLGASKTATEMARALGSAPAKSTPKAASVSPPSKRRPANPKAAAKSGVKTGGSYYDPLNGAL